MWGSFNYANCSAIWFFLCSIWICDSIRSFHAMLKILGNCTALWIKRNRSYINVGRSSLRLIEICPRQDYFCGGETINIERTCRIRHLLFCIFLFFIFVFYRLWWYSGKKRFKKHFNCVGYFCCADFIHKCNHNKKINLLFFL